MSSLGAAQLNQLMTRRELFPANGNPLISDNHYNDVVRHMYLAMLSGGDRRVKLQALRGLRMMTFMVTDPVYVNNIGDCLRSDDVEIRQSAIEVLDHAVLLDASSPSSSSRPKSCSTHISNMPRKTRVLRFERPSGA